MSDATTAVTPTRRNAVVVQVIPMVCYAAMFPLGGLLGTTAFRSAPTFAQLAGTLFFLGAFFAMIRELNAVSEQKLTAWHVIIPLYNLYWLVAKVRPAVAAAKQRAGKPEARGTALYLLLCLYALAADLNDLAEG